LGLKKSGGFTWELRKKFGRCPANAWQLPASGETSAVRLNYTRIEEADFLWLVSYEEKKAEGP
jgi:hypothetical protein